MNSAAETGTFLACLCAGAAVVFTTFVIVDFFSYVSARYRDRYIEETATELDDVLLQVPPERILDLTLAISALAAFAAVMFLAVSAATWSWTKAVFVACIVFVATFPLPRLYLRFLKKRRLERFNEQLEDALNSMSSSLKAGFSINQAIEVIADENRHPISVEFRLLMQEIRLGVSLDKALENMNRRLQSDDFELVATAILTARQTGGELTVIFERLAAMIRERLRIALRLKTLTAQGRLQAIVVGIMPFFLMLVMNQIAPEMMNRFFNSLMGIALIAAAVALDIIGFLVIRKITNIDI